MFQGLPKRFWSEMAKLVPRRDYLNIIATKDRKYSTWQGGSKLASLSSFESKWITRDDYDEYGAEVVTESAFDLLLIFSVEMNICNLNF